MTLSILMIVVFVATSCAVAAIASLVFEGRLREQWLTHQRLTDRFQPNQESRVKRSPLFRDLKTLHTQTKQGYIGLQQRFAIALEQSGLSVSAQQILMVAAGAGAVAALLAYLASPLPLLAFPAGIITVAIPFLYVEYKRRTRIQKLCRQLPDAFDQLKRAVKAGHTIGSAMQVVVADMQAPISEEFAICCQQQEFGLSMHVTLHDLARRTGVMELRMFAVGLVVQSESGGNCLELLSNLSEMIRKRLHLVTRVKALTSEGRLQAIVLTLLPILAFVLITILDPGYIQPLLERPKILLGIIAAQTLGMLWIRKIINIEY
ncbi:pilus assembly protein TadB [bacterium]|nr:pilus assembly protein TadB [bacterium]